MELAFEVVRVLDEHNLINSESYQCKYDTGYGDALAPGYYVVASGAPLGLIRYDDTGRFFGPFASKTEAELFVQQAAHPSVERAQPEYVSTSLH
jgi:hypothetical protein